MLERVFGSQPHFDPAREHREFVILASDYAVDGLRRRAGARDQRAGAAGPGHLPAAVRTMIDDPPAHLSTVDGLFMPHGIITGLPAVELFSDRWLCAVAEDNPDVGESITLASSPPCRGRPTSGSTPPR